MQPLPLEGLFFPDVIGEKIPNAPAGRVLFYDLFRSRASELFTTCILATGTETERSLHMLPGYDPLGCTVCSAEVLFPEHLVAYQRPADLPAILPSPQYGSFAP
jgi:hypothetical protein